MKESCIDCGGSGLKEEAKCPRCGGRGYVLTHEDDIPQKMSTENLYKAPEDFWDDFSDEGKVTFNFLYEYMDRNPDSIFATDIFRLDDFTNEQVQKVYKIMNAAKFNISLIAAEFVSGNMTNPEQ